MTINVAAYFQEVDQMPWGKLFYQLLWDQLEELTEKQSTNLRILDFGAGFCKTADHLAQAGHIVTAYEPNSKLASRRYQNAEYRFIGGDLPAFLEAVAGKQFDFILLHNVLEYITDRDEILLKLWDHLAPGGCISLVKHNPRGRIMLNAVLRDDPQRALAELHGVVGQSVNFGQILVYPNEWLWEWIRHHQGALVADYGIRMFYGLSQNSEVKFTDQWQKEMYQLENECGTDPGFREIAMFRHFGIVKTSH
ncbi:class I SAM-dependent methyltransferase [Enterococcus diestrammenae]|uniref:class I SAM-dependent methyltransferase n=1 Tax=Enterococcus diestrammenae TaxID=1155073 RepID=UPI0022E5E170|nr:methyltransferase [Enterococcus diestrammenae]